MCKYMIEPDNININEHKKVVVIINKTLFCHQHSYAQTRIYAKFQDVRDSILL